MICSDRPKHIELFLFINTELFLFSYFKKRSLNEFVLHYEDIVGLFTVSSFSLPEKKNIQNIIIMFTLVQICVLDIYAN